MQKQIYSSYYHGSQIVFQDLLSNSSLPFSSVLSSWAKKLILPQWFKPSACHSCTDRFPVLPDSWGRAFGPRRRWWRRLCTNSSTPCRSKPLRFCFSSSMIPSSKRQGKRFQDVVGIRIMLNTWPMSSATNGFFQPCSIKTFSSLSGQTSTILRGQEDAVLSRPRSLWPKGSLKGFDFLCLVNSMSWLIVGTGRGLWFEFAGGAAII